MEGLEKKIKNAKGELCFSYARISSRKQEKGNSLEDQKSEAYAYAERNNLNLVHVFEAVESAYDEDRVVFNEMFQAARRYDVKHIIFKTYDRAARNSLDWHKVTNGIKKYRFIIHFYEMNIMLDESSTAEEFFMGNMNNAMAQFWSNKIAQSIKRANYHKVLTRKTAIRAPLGYIWNAEEKQWVIDRDAISIIKEIYDSFNNNMSLSEVVDLLNAKGCRTAKGSRWHKSTVDHVLRNKFYAGYLKYKGKYLEGAHEPVFTLEYWEKTQRGFENRFKGWKQNDTGFLLRGFVRCAECKRLYYGVRAKKYVYYDHKCDGIDHKKIREEALLEMLDTEVEKIIFDDNYADFLMKLLKKTLRDDRRVREKGESDLSKRVNELRRKKDKLLELYVDSVIDKDDLYRKVEGIEKDIVVLEQKRKQLDIDVSKHEYKAVEIIDFLRNFSSTYLQDTPEGKLQFLKLMAAGATIDKGKIKVEWLKPFDFLLTPELKSYAAPPVGLEPTTNWLTANCSTD